MIYNQLSRYGAIAKNLPFTVGKIFFVVANTETYFKDFEFQFPVDSEGVSRVYSTVAGAYAATVSGRNDIILIDANATHSVTAMLDISKSRVHFMAMDARTGFGLGARAKISMDVTTAATDLGVMKNTGVGNTFTGIKFISNNTKDESLYSVVEAGEYTIYERCEFYKSTDLDQTAAAEVVNNGDSAQFIKCVFGSSANIIADDKIRPCMLLSGGIVTGKKCRDGIIDNCIFLSKSAGTEHVDIYGANATDVERMLLVKDTVFLSNKLGAATPAHAVGFGAAQTEGSVILKNCTSVDHTVMAQAAVGIYVDGAVPTFATTGVAVAA